MLFLDGVYVERPDGLLRFRWVKAPTNTELTRLAQTLARRIGRFLERQGLLERDAENSYLAGDAVEAGPMDQLLGSSITYRIALGPQQGRKVFTLQTLPACDEPFDDGVGKVAGFSLHAGVAARADERKKLERHRVARRCRHRPAPSEPYMRVSPHTAQALQTYPLVEGHAPLRCCFSGLLKSPLTVRMEQHNIG